MTWEWTGLFIENKGEALFQPKAASPRDIKLCVAAPELYEALGEAVELLDNLLEDDRVDIKFINPTEYGRAIRRVEELNRKWKALAGSIQKSKSNSQ